MEDLNKAFEAYQDALDAAKDRLFSEMVLPKVKKRAVELGVKNMRASMGMVYSDNANTWEGTKEQKEFMEWFMRLTTEHDLMNGLV